MPARNIIDRVDARLLLALADAPRATVLALAQRLGLSRNTVQARLDKLEAQSALDSAERRIRPAALGYPLTAFIMVQVTQRWLAELAHALNLIPEIIEVHGLSGQTDLLVHVVATDAEHLYRIAGQILATQGVERTTTSLVVNTLVSYRLTPLLQRLASGQAPGR
jgi:DNA-binding Lrp family transcriptional regulator